MTWRAIQGYGGLYAVSDQGEVRSYFSVLPRVLKQGTQKNGYKVVHLCLDGQRTAHRVHVLVCEAFHGQRPINCVARHLNDDKRDNRAENLAWGTHSENREDSRRNGTLMQGEGHANARLTVPEVIDILYRLGDGEKQSVIAERYGISQSLVSQIKLGKKWSSV